MSRRFPARPAHPERICWGCDRYCPAHDMKCGNGSVPTPHPSELFGDDWMRWGLDAYAVNAQSEAQSDATHAPNSVS